VIELFLAPKAGHKIWQRLEPASFKMLLVYILLGWSIVRHVLFPTQKVVDFPWLKNKPIIVGKIH
jgi:hypothetical protein